MVMRRLAEKGLPRGHGGPLAWLWGASAPFWGLGLLAALLSGAPGYALLLALGLATSLKLYYQGGALEEARAALQVPEMDGRWAGALVDALEAPNRRVQAVARLRLTTLLPLLTRAEAAGLTDAQRGALYDRLEMWAAAREPDFAVAILQAMKRIGDEEALAPVERLARITAWTPGLRRVREAARACLPGLERRIAGAWAEENAPAVPVSADGEPGRTPDPTVEARLREMDAREGKQPGMRFGFLLAAWGIILPFTVWCCILFVLQGQWLWAGCFLFLVIVICRLHNLTLSPRQARLARELAGLNDVQAVGRLAEALEWPDTRLRGVARSALVRLLPRLKATDANLLNASQRANLYRLLRPSRVRAVMDLQIALLKALEQVGDPEAIPRVQALADSQPHGLRQTRVRDAARECLPFLLERASQNRDSLRLLRPAVAPAAPGDLLLRPASGRSETAPEQLLRASAAETDEGVAGEW